MQSSYMSFNADATYPGRQSIGDDDEIISGEQKTSPKCPVSPVDVDPEGGCLIPSANSHRSITHQNL